MPAIELPTFVDLAQPAYLAVLVVLPLVVLLSLRSLAGLGPVRRPFAIGTRCVVIIVLVLALAVPEWVRTVDDQTVTFALDQSDSVPKASRSEAMAFMRRAAAGMRPGKDRVAMLSFAGRTSVEQLPHAALAANGTGDPGDPYRTNIAGALRLGLALFPGDSAKRLVVLSDGNENSGVAAQEADSYAALGIPIDVVPLRYKHAGEILVDQLSAPATAARDEPINLQVVVRSQVATTARLVLYRNDRLVDLDPTSPNAGSPIQLVAGSNRFSVSVGLSEPGVHRFRAVVVPDNPDADPIVVNNEGRAFTIVGEAARVTIVSDLSEADPETDAASAEILAAALRDGGVECDLISVDELPSDPASLADCAALILSNVPAYALGQAKQEMLASYVRDQGGGLIAMGGDRAFSVGGYTETLLEEILPVETKRDELRMLSLAMVIVIDRSGSMVGEKIAMSRTAAIGAVKLLSRLDYVGVVAFEGAPEWVVPLQDASNRSAIASRIDSIGGGGGTNMYPALQMAATALLSVNAHVKHIIVLTDGQSMPGDFDGVAQSCRRNGITISAIAVGRDADRPLLSRIAGLSGGRMYFAESARPLPQIFARETVLASRSGLYERPFTPKVKPTIDEGIMIGVASTQIPTLRGHVVTDAKPMAQTLLVRATDKGGDPILSYWQVGLGRTVAFTSGFWPRWGPDWVSWPGFGKLWTQAVRYVARLGNTGDLEIQTKIEGNEAHVIVSADHLPLNVLGSLAVSGQVIAPDFSVIPLALQRTAADRFEAVFQMDAPGTYLLDLPYTHAGGGEASSGVLRTGIVQSYSPEYRTLQYDENTLVELARRTGGRVLNPDYPDAVFETASIRPVQVRRPFWEELIRLALVLFLVDVAVRRIAVSPAATAAKLRRVLHEFAGARPDADSVATLGALRDVKSRTQADTQAPANAPADTSSAAAILDRLDLSDPVPSTGTRNVLEPQKAPTAAPPREAAPPATPDRNHTARLLRAKRRARGQEDQD